MASKRAKKIYKMQRMADGGVVNALKNRNKLLDEAEAKALAPAPAPAAPAKEPVTIIPGLADQIAAKEAARVKAEAEAAAKAAVPKKKFLGLFADGGRIAGTWDDAEHRTSLRNWSEPTAAPAPVAPTTAAPAPIAPQQALPTQPAQPAAKPVVASKPALTTVTTTSSPETDNSLKGYKFDRSTMSFDPRASALAGQPNPLVIDTIGSTADRAWNKNIGSSTGYPMLADGGQVWGGPEEDNLSTKIHSPIYKGLGGKWDGMPMFADGGNVRRKNVERGMIHGEGGPTEDKQPIMASPGEFVIPADSVDKIGLRHLRNMVAMTHKPVHTAMGMADGGWLDKFNPMRFFRKTPAADAATGSTAPAPEVTPTSTPKWTGRTPGWRSGMAPPADAWTTAEGLKGPGGGVSMRPLPPTPPVGSGLREPLPREASRATLAAIQTMRGIPQLQKGVGLALAAAPYLGLAGSFNEGEHVPTPGGEKSDIPTVSEEFRNQTAKYEAAKPSTVTPLEGQQFGMNDRGIGYNPTTPAPVVPPGPGEGVVSDASGRSLRTTPGEFPDTRNQPSIDQVNAAARAEMQAMNERNATAGAAEGRRLDDMRLRNQLNVAQYELGAGERGTAQFDPQRMAQLRANVQAAQAALTGQDNRTLARDLKGMDTAAEVARTKELAAASRYGADQRLRGDITQAKATVLGHQIDAERAAAALQHTVGKENMADFEKMIANRAQVFRVDDKGAPVLDPAATQAKGEAFRRFMVNPTADSIAIIKSIDPKANSLRDLPVEKWGSVYDKWDSLMGVSEAVGAQGMPDTVRAKERGLRDTIGGPGVNSKVPIVGTLFNNFNPFASPEQNVTLRVNTPGALPTDAVWQDITRGDRGKSEAVISRLRSSGDPESVKIANEMAKRLGIR